MALKNKTDRNGSIDPARARIAMPVLRLVVKTILLFFVVSTLATPAYSQTSAGLGGSEKGKGPIGPRKQLATIVFAGLGGAVLGLSTLSFYGRPQENLRNIAIGAAFGVIGGTIMVTYKAATNPSELYGEQRAIENDFAATSTSSAAMTTASPPSPLGFKLAFEF